jgi:hypothetical protein
MHARGFSKFYPCKKIFMHGTTPRISSIGSRSIHHAWCSLVDGDASDEADEDLGDDTLSYAPITLIFTLMYR